MEDISTPKGWYIIKIVLLLMFGPLIVYFAAKASNAVRKQTKQLNEEVSMLSFVATTALK